VSSIRQTPHARDQPNVATRQAEDTTRAARRHPQPLPVVSIEEGYELWAPTYDRDLNPLLALEERTLDPLLPRMQAKTVLDLACGTGRWLGRLMDSGARHAIGIDLSRAMLARASMKSPLRGRLVRGNCLSLPVRAELADMVICSLAVGHILDLEGLAQEVARVAKPESDLYVTDVHPEAYAKGWRNGFRHEMGSREIATFAHSKDDILRTFRGRGFEISLSLEPHFAEPERLLFERAGKIGLFDEFCKLPALLICHFARGRQPRIST
jgi:malonyl-CoA O-methyltransferase